MDTPSLIRLLESDASRAEKRTALRRIGPRPGVCEAAFRSVAGLLGADIGRARAVASLWPELVTHGDDRSYGLRTKAVYLRLQGKWSESATAFRQAGLATERLPDRFSFQTGAVDSLGRAGEVKHAVRLGKQLAAELDGLGEVALAARVKLNLGNALLWQDRYREAKSWLEQAVYELEASGLNAEAASAKLGLSTAHLFGGSPRLAQEWAQAAEFAYSSLGAGHHKWLAAINRAQAVHLTGRHDEALDLLLLSRSHLDAEPFEKGRCFEFAGFVYLALNLPSEATDSFRQALKVFRSVDAPLNRANCLLGLGLAAAALGSVRQPALYFQKARGAYTEAGNRVWAAASLVQIARQLCARGQVARALEAAETASDELRMARSKYHRAEAELVLAECQLAAGKEPNFTLRRAKRLIARNAYIQMEWRVHWLAGRIERGRRAEGHFIRMVDSIIGSRLLTTSTLSRAAFYRDKTEAIAEFIDLLLASPTPKRVNRVVSIVRASRSAALADEILAGRRTREHEKLTNQLQELREELNQLSGEAIPGFERRAAIGHPAVHALRRRWAEVRRDTLGMVSSTPSQRPSLPTTILVQTRERLFSIRDSKLTRLGCSTQDLKELLKWLRFDLLAPMADAGIQEQPALESLRKVQRRLGLHVPEASRIIAISPDASLWQVPWQAVLNAEICSLEPILLPNAGFFGTEARADLGAKPRVAIWAGESSHIPHVREEAEFLRSLYPDALVARNLVEIRRSMEEGPWDLVHVAGHAGLNAENPMFSFISFSDGLLYADDIARSDLQVRHICLSACDTGSVSIVNATEPDGIARAFLARGASTVLATSWPVDDRTAKEFVTDYYQGLVEGRTLINALAEARHRCRTRRPHPYYWGCWVMFGGYQ